MLRIGNLCPSSIQHIYLHTTHLLDQEQIFQVLLLPWTLHLFLRCRTVYPFPEVIFSLSCCPVRCLVNKLVYLSLFFPGRRFSSANFIPYPISRLLSCNKFVISFVVCKHLHSWCISVLTPMGNEFNFQPTFGLY